MPRLALLVAAGCASLGLAATAAQPTVAAPLLFSSPFLQSPVRGGPNDLLMLAGAGFADGDLVVFRRVNDNDPLTPPGEPPATTPNWGYAPVVSFADLPHSIVVKLPALMIPDATYALWVLRGTSWSNPVRINDARPLWITPPFTYSSASADFLLRELKIVGRNLNPVPGASTLVRLAQRLGPTPAVDLTATPDPAQRYVARVTLPPLGAGSYEVSVSRDSGQSWVKLAGQLLDVRPNPSSPATFPVAAHGCNAGDGTDDTPCVKAAIAAALAAGGGEVTFGPGWWRLNPHATDLDPAYGIVVPPGVWLRGTGPGGFAPTTVERSAAWPPGLPVFTLQGRNQIRGIRFQDAQLYPLNPADEGIPSNAFFLLGKYASDPNGGPAAVDEVVFHDNVFAGPFYALQDGQRPIHRLFVTDNEFGAYHDALYLAGPVPISATKFRIDDAVIARNTFKPGRYYDPDNNGQGTIASQLGASFRVDFSHNFADGRASEYLQPGDPKGWRGVSYWHFQNNHEQLLVSDNHATCTGDKAGDGEFLGTDGNKNHIPSEQAQRVLSAGARQVTVEGTPPPAYPSDYFSEHWALVVAGRSLGAARKIVSYRTRADTTTYVISPEWDVVPDTTSRVVISRTAWQVYMVGNEVDQRDCVKPRKLGRLTQAGVISFFSSATDSVIEANTQYESDGVLLNAKYQPTTEYGPTDHQLHYFNQVWGNRIYDEYDYDWQCSRGGIKLWYSGHPDWVPAGLAAYGVSVAHNIIQHGDAMFGGAIAFEPAWYNLPGAYWSSTLVFENDIRDIVTPDLPGIPICGATTRAGLRIDNANVHHTVLSNNPCVGCSDGVPALIDNGTGTIEVQ